MHPGVSRYNNGQRYILVTRYGELSRFIPNIELIGAMARIECPVESSLRLPIAVRTAQTRGRLTGAIPLASTATPSALQ